MKYFLTILFLFSVSAGLMSADEPPASATTVQPWAGPEAEQQLAQDFAGFLKGAEIRAPGTPGNLKMEQRIADLFEDKLLENGTIEFCAPCFVPGKTSLALPGGEPINIHPMQPTLFRPGNFDERNFEANLIYMGEGTADDLDRMKGVDLKDAIIVMELGCERNWVRLLRFGAKGFIFLASDSNNRNDAITKMSINETRIPRFYVAASDAGMLRKTLEKGVVKAKIDAVPSTWERKNLRDLWVFIPGTDENLAKEVCVLMAPIDSNCIVPGMAAGAQSAANLFVLTRLYEHFKENPPARSILIAAVNGHTLRFMGERMLVWNLLAPNLENTRDTINTDIRVSQIYVDEYSKLDLSSKNEETEQLLIKFRAKLDTSTAVNLAIKKPIVTIVKGKMNAAKLAILTLSRNRKTMDPAKYEQAKAQLEKEKNRYINVLTLFNKVGIKTTLSDLSPEELDILRTHVDEIIKEHTESFKLNKEYLARDVANSQIRMALEGRRIVLAMEMDFDWSGDDFGFAVGANQQWAIKWGANTQRIVSELPSVAEGTHKSLLVDTLTMQGGTVEQYFFHDSGTFTSFRDYFFSAGKTAAFSLRNVFSFYNRGFLPSDDLEHLNIHTVAQIDGFLPTFLSAVFNDETVTLPSELGSSGMDIRHNAPIWSTHIKTMKFDELASASVIPDIPVGNTAVLLSPAGYPATYSPVVSADVLGAYMALTDSRGTAIFYGLTEKSLASQAFRFDPDFITVNHAIDAGDKQAKVDSNINNGQSSKILAMFECKELPLPAFYDSSQIPSPPPVSTVIPLSPVGDSPPKMYGSCGISSEVSTKIVPGNGFPGASLFLKKNDRVKIITAGKRLILNAKEDDPEGIGYLDAEELGCDPMATAARDMSMLNEARIKRLRDVANDLARLFLDRGNKAITAMEDAMEENDHITYLRSLYEAVGSQVKSYRQSKATIDDMLKAVVVYMALLLPFCFFVQKLLFKFVKIEAEMGAFAALFVLTFLLFRLIHPAFRVAQAAEAIFVAFIMGTLGLFVILILKNRFDAEMQFLFRSYTASAVDEASDSTAFQKAMMIGVNNMKRRRMRTTLTTATIVLVAFTMLSFTSISKKVNPTIISRGKSVPYTGFMYHLPGKLFLTDVTVNILKTIFNAKGEVVVRYWLTPGDDEAPFRLAANNGNHIDVEAALGIPAIENGFIEDLPVAAGRSFSADDAKEAMISVSAAEALDIDIDHLENVSFRFQGVNLKLVGVLDDTALRAIKDLNGAPIVPIRHIATDSGPSESKQELESMMMAAENNMDEGSGIFFYVDTASLLVLPFKTSKLVYAKPYSVSVKLKPTEPIWPIIDTMLTDTDAKFYVSSMGPFTTGEEGKNKVSAGIYYVGSNYKTAIGGLAVLLIPLFISSTIILNTMLGSVYERKKEIAVYNAVGLNPHHIGIFFLAESFVYGVIGAVGGYLIGQILSILINQFGVVSGINLNYSSLSVAYVIVFTVSVVVLSTIYPAVVATKAAVPSGKRKWSMPDRVGDEMNVLFPFIYHPRLAIGVLAYVREYFSAFTEASFGDLIAEELDHGVSADADKKTVYEMKYHITLAPFDLGVTQSLDFTLSYNQRVQAYQLHMRITRVSGQDVNWITTNKPFLERLRKFLMRWRNLDTSQHMLYVQQAGQFFGEE